MKTFAIVFGIVFLALGIAGFVPALCPNGLMFGIFAVDTMHNIVHIVTGLAAIGFALAGAGPARMFFRIFGVIYGLIAILGFVLGRDGQLFGMAMNMADHWLHVAVAAVSLWAGFAWHPDSETPPRHDPGLSGV